MNRNVAFQLWVVFRVARWLCWLIFLGWSAYFAWDPRPHLNSFGHLLPSGEIILFGMSMIAVFAGFFELMMRDYAGLVAPNPFQLVPAQGKRLADR